jgi:hypothetical protein
MTAPTRIEKKLRLKKLPTILNIVEPVNSESGPEYSSTVLNKMMQTASLVMPSPKIKLKSFGYSSYFTIEIAATTSVQHSNEHIINISIIDSLKCSYSLYIINALIIAVELLVCNNITLFLCRIWSTE